MWRALGILLVSSAALFAALHEPPNVHRAVARLVLA
jgi:hypothetical protein